MIIRDNELHFLRVRMEVLAAKQLEARLRVDTQAVKRLADEMSAVRLEIMKKERDKWQNT